MKNYTPKLSESTEQINLFRWAACMSGKYPELQLLYHIPNGGKRDVGTARKLKAEGVKPGVPDLCLPVPRGDYHGMYIEMKVNKNKTTEYQDQWLDALSDNGYYTAVCYNWDAASIEILKYLNLKR